MREREINVHHCYIYSIQYSLPPSHSKWTDSVILHSHIFNKWVICNGAEGVYKKRERERGILCLEQFGKANGVFLARNQQEIRQKLLNNRCNNNICFLLLHKFLIKHTVWLIVQLHFPIGRSHNIAAPITFFSSITNHSRINTTTTPKLITYPFSGRCQGGPRTGPAVARTFTEPPSLPRISVPSPGSRYVTYHFISNKHAFNSNPYLLDTFLDHIWV